MLSPEDIQEEREKPDWSRRALLKALGSAPILLRAAPLLGSGPEPLPPAGSAFHEVRLVPRYPAPSPLQDVLALVEAGSDEFQLEKHAFAIAKVLDGWRSAWEAGHAAAIGGSLDPGLLACSLSATRRTTLRERNGISCFRLEYSETLALGADRFVAELLHWLGRDVLVQTAEMEITSIEQLSDEPLVRTGIRYDLVSHGPGERREERVGSWTITWRPGPQDAWVAQEWRFGPETLSRIDGPAFVDVTHQALGRVESYQAQILRGSDTWRTLLDGACGIDVYGNNGVAAGDYNNDGLDDIYVSQPAGLPNRLYRNRGDGTFDDVTDQAGVGVLDNTACALFADFRNSGLQDLLVVCGSGPLLFLNQGDGTFALKRDAFHFAQSPQGTFTHAAIADYDRDGRLDIYFCLYSYYLGLDQYHYPVPYYDARNGPPNFLLRNTGDATFVDRTEASGLNADNNRYSFAAAWGEAAPGSGPDLYVVNDFGRNNLYRNQGDGTFRVDSTHARVEDVGAGMSACWADTTNSRRSDLYVANMWSAAGQRVSAQANFHPRATAETRGFYQRHARGNALYRNGGDGRFADTTLEAGVEMGRWAWCSDFWDFDHDGYADLYVTNGYVSAPASEGAPKPDLGSFFWRQVVARSPDDATPLLAYERGWNALNELIRSDYSWSGRERNVLFANHGDGSFSEISGAAGMDWLEDGRSFALADIDQDGRLEVILKSRNAPQLRILHNAMRQTGNAIAFRLRGTKSNRDAIGASITIEAAQLRQTKYLQAGSGFLAQHSKEIFFGLAQETTVSSAIVQWPSGLTQRFESLPAQHRISIEEGSSTYHAEPFRPAPAAYAQSGPLLSIESLPASVETWLVHPIPAPGFSLPDLSGAIVNLHDLQGTPVLLHLWTSAAPSSVEQLDLLTKHRGILTQARVRVLSVNLDQAASDRARELAGRSAAGYPVLFATEEFAGVYNLTYRYLFDRRRDLGIPTSFLIDLAGSIVKVYQGALDPSRILADSRSIPTSPAERVAGALPFPGTLYQQAFTRNDFTYGVAMFQHGYLDQAAASFGRVVAASPENAEGYYNLGTLNLRRGRFAEARRYLEQTIKLRPNYPEAWNNLGMMAAQDGRADEAVRNFEQSLAQRPHYAVALENLGNLYRRQGSTAKAETLLRQALELEPDNPEIHYSLGMLYAQNDQLQAASDSLQTALKLRPNYPEALNNLGVLLVRAQQYAQAEDRFRTCIRVAPRFDQSYLNLARLYMVQHDKARAREALQDLLKLQPDNAKAQQGLQVIEQGP